MADLKISQLTEMTTPADADVQPIVETGTATTKKITWANIKAKLKNYFDTIYEPIISALAVNKGGTGATTASGARTNLGLAIGSDVQAWDADLDTWATKTPPSGTPVGTTDTQDLSNKNILTGENAQTGTTYTLVLSDAGKCVTMNNASANTLIIPPNSSVAFSVGTKIMITQLGAGATTIAADSGVTLNAPAGVAANINEQYGSRVIWKRATDTWVLI